LKYLYQIIPTLTISELAEIDTELLVIKTERLLKENKRILLENRKLKKENDLLNRQKNNLISKVKKYKNVKPYEWYISENEQFVSHNIIKNPIYEGKNNIDELSQYDIKFLKILTLNNCGSEEFLAKFINLEKLYLIGNFEFDVPNTLSKLKKLSITRYEYLYVEIPDTLTNLEYLYININTNKLSPKFTKLKKLRIVKDEFQLLLDSSKKLTHSKYCVYNISCIPEEYINLKKVWCRNLFHKVNENIIYENDNKEELKKLYNTLIKMQRTTRLKIAKAKMRLLYNPLYIGGYLGKKRLEKVFIS
jgi:hypothetical protein